MSVIPWPLNPSSRAQPAAARASAPDDVAGLAAALIQSRQTILPKRPVSYTHLTLPTNREV